MGPGDPRLGACCGVALAALSAAPNGSPRAPDGQARSSLHRPDAAAATRAGAPPEPRAPSPWPDLAAVLPGVLIHGSGTWLQGRRLTTERLLLLEAAGVLAILAGGLVVYETGAARDIAGPATLLIAAGAGTLSSSLLASLYATWAPRSGRGYQPGACRPCGLTRARTARARAATRAWARSRAPSPRTAAVFSAPRTRGSVRHAHRQAAREDVLLRTEVADVRLEHARGGAVEPEVERAGRDEGQR